MLQFIYSSLYIKVAYPLFAECAGLDYILEHRHTSIDYVMNNNFSFGGINTSLIFSKV